MGLSTTHSEEGEIAKWKPGVQRIGWWEELPHDLAYSDISRWIGSSCLKHQLGFQKQLKRTSSRTATLFTDFMAPKSNIGLAKDLDQLFMLFLFASVIAVYSVYLIQPPTGKQLTQAQASLSSSIGNVKIIMILAFFQSHVKDVWDNIYEPLGNILEMHNIDLKYYTSVITKQIFISGKNFNLVVKPNVLGPAFAAEFPGYCVVLIYICIFLPAPPHISHTISPRLLSAHNVLGCKLWQWNLIPLPPKTVFVGFFAWELSYIIPVLNYTETRCSMILNVQ